VKDYTAEDAVDLTRAMGLDGVWVPFGGFIGYEPQWVGEKAYVDEWGTTYQKEASSWPLDAPIDFPLKSRADLAHYKAPDPTLPGRMASLERALAMAGGEIAILGGAAGPFTNAWMMLGPKYLFECIYDDPDLVKECFRLSNSFNLEAAKIMVAGGVDAVIVSDDFGHSSAGFISPRHFRELVLPYFAELVETIVGLGKPVLLHSCGHIKPYLDGLVETGIAGYHPLQRTAGMDLGEVRAQYGHRLCLVGNIDSSVTLPYGSEEEVEAEVQEAIRVAGPGGAYVVASDHSLHDGIPMRNVRRMIEATLKYGKYPLGL
jgi:uroporphyrinogen decarboxylase